MIDLFHFFRRCCFCNKRDSVLNRVTEAWGYGMYGGEHIVDYHPSCLRAVAENPEVYANRKVKFSFFRAEDFNNILLLDMALKILEIEESEKRLMQKEKKELEKKRQLVKARMAYLVKSKEKQWLLQSNVKNVDTGI